MINIVHYVLDFQTSKASYTQDREILTSRFNVVELLSSKKKKIVVELVNQHMIFMNTFKSMTYLSSNKTCA